MNGENDAWKVLNLLKVKRGGTIDTIARSLGMKPEDVKEALEHLKREGSITQSGDGFFYVGRFVRFTFSSDEETRVGSISRYDILKGEDFLLESERMTLTNVTDEEFMVTFNITGIESAELARRFSFVVDEETGKELTKLCRENPNLLMRPIIEKKAVTFDKILPKQTKKYRWEFVVDREYMEKVPKNELNCTLKINCISLNYHDFSQISIRLDPGWL